MMRRTLAPAVAVAAIVAVGALFLFAPGGPAAAQRGPSPTPSPAPSPSPAQSPTPTASPSPTVVPSPSPTPSPPAGATTVAANRTLASGETFTSDFYATATCERVTVSVLANSPPAVLWLAIQLSLDGVQEYGTILFLTVNQAGGADWTASNLSPTIQRTIGDNSTISTPGRTTATFAPWAPRIRFVARNPEGGVTFSLLFYCVS